MIVIGAGLAGLTTTLTLLERGARVLLLEREGNSNAKRKFEIL